MVWIGKEEGFHTSHSQYAATRVSSQQNVGSRNGHATLPVLWPDGKKSNFSQQKYRATRRPQSIRTNKLRDELLG